MSDGVLSAALNANAEVSYPDVNGTSANGAVDPSNNPQLTASTKMDDYFASYLDGRAKCD
jgi:hypothetical protein